MSPRPSDSEGSGPVDGEKIELKLTPHHQAHKPKAGFPLAKTLFTGTAIVGGIVGLYFLYKHFFGKKNKDAANAGNGNNGGNANANGNGNGGNASRKRDVRWEDVVGFESGTAVGDRMMGVYEEALVDEGFLEFMEKVYDGGVLDLSKVE
jgi:hypothetical protein